MAMDVAAAPWLTEARKFVGLKEIVGSRHEPKILEFFAEAGHPGIHDDETAWCAAFVGAMLRRAGYSSSGALNARSYLNFGTKLAKPTPGCIVVFKRGSSSWQGHVAFFIADEGDRIRVLGGNQGNAVSIASYSKADLLGYRWPLVKSAPAAKAQPKKPAVEKAKDAGKVGGGIVGTGTVAVGVEAGWGAWEWFMAALVLAAVAGAAYGIYRWWRLRRAKAEGIAAVEEALAPTDPDVPVAQALNPIVAGVVARRKRPVKKAKKAAKKPAKKRSAAR
jgi:uncharacterized protein (TIGR02594 family)